MGGGDYGGIRVEEGVQAKLMSTREPRLRMNESLEMTGMGAATSGRRCQRNPLPRRRPKRVGTAPLITALAIIKLADNYEPLLRRYYEVL